LTTQNIPDDHYGSAVAFLLFGVSAGLGLDLCAKWLLADYSLVQFVFLRSIFGLLFFLFTARFYGGLGGLKTSRWRWHLLRTLLATGAMFGFFFGLSRMPLVNALTIRRWLAVIAGFIGVVIVLRPGQGMFTPAAIGVIIAAICYAGLALTARKLAATESSFALSVYVVAGPLLVSTTLISENYTAPTAGGWFFFALAGMCSALAWVGIIGGYRRAPPAMLAPFEYTAMTSG
jgi:drug/metabolite transporter (DMT)-like permease